MRWPTALLAPVAITVTWLLSGVPLHSAALFAGYELLYVLVPGCLLYAALAPVGGGWLHAIAIGWPLGYALEMGAFALTAALGVRASFVFLPLAAVAVLGPPALLRHGLPRAGGSSAVLGWLEARILARLRSPLLARADLVVVSAAVATAVVLLALTFFATYPLPEDAHSVVYYVDNVWDISLAAEARNHWPLTEPYVAGHSLLHYYYGVFLHIAAVNQVTGVPLATTVLRLLPTSAIAVGALQLWSLGRSMGQSPWVGPTAVTLLLVVEDLNLDPTRPGAFAAEVFKVIPLSPTFALGMVFFLGSLVLMQSWLGLEDVPDAHTPHSGTRSPPAFAGWLAMTAILVIGMSMVKAPAAADFIGGLALFWLWRAFTTGIDRLLSYSLGLAAICAVAVYVLVLRGSPVDALHLSLFHFVDATNFATILHMHGIAHIIPLLGVVTVACLFSLAPLLGACALLWRQSALSLFVQFCLAVFAVSLLAYLTLGAPGDGEGYFLSFGYLALVPVAAAGLTWLWTDASPGGRASMVKACGAILALGLLAAASTLALKRFEGVRLYAWYAAAYGLLGGVIAVVAVKHETIFIPAISSRVARLLACCIPMLVVLGLVKPLDAAVPNAWKVISHMRVSTVDSRRNQGMTAALYRGLVWVREHTDSCDVLAVNNHLTKAHASASYSRYYYYSAFTERRVFLESWYYSARVNGKQPFPARLALNELAIAHGDPAALRELRRRGVRYVLIDKTHGWGAPEPSNVSQLVFANSALEVYRLAGDGDTGVPGRECRSGA